MQIQNPFEEIAERLSRIEHCLIDIKKNKKSDNLSQPESDQLLPAPQAAEFLNLSIFTIYGLVHQRKLIHYKQGKKLMFKKSELLQFVEAGRKKTVSEIDTEAETFLLAKKKK